MSRLFGRYYGGTLPRVGEAIALDIYDGFFDFEATEVPDRFSLRWERAPSHRRAAGVVEDVSPGEALQILEVPMVECVRLRFDQSELRVRVDAVGSLRQQIADGSATKNRVSSSVSSALTVSTTEWGLVKGAHYLPTQLALERVHRRPIGAGVRIQTGSYPQSDTFVLLTRAEARVLVMRFGAFEPESSSWYEI